jgi:hypothetical protein
MHEYRQKSQIWLNFLFISILCISLSGCSVYTINKSDLENGLKPKPCHSCKKVYGLNQLTAMYNKQYSNNIDTIRCADALGQIKTKRFTYDTKVTVKTKQNKTIKYYAKTLYIWKEEFLVGERTAPAFYGPNYLPIKLADIVSIEVKKPWF